MRRILFLCLLFFTVLLKASSPILGDDGVLVFRSEGNFIDNVKITTVAQGTKYKILITGDGERQVNRYPITSVHQFRYLNKEMTDGLDVSAVPDLRVEIGHYQSYEPKISEMEDFLDLVRYNDVTVSSTGSGDWSNPSTWEGGVVPQSGARVLIEAGHTVTIDSEIADAVRTVRVDGTIRFSTTQNSSLKVDTMCVMGGGTYEMGTELNPVPEGITAKLIIEDIGDFVDALPNDPSYDHTDPDYDPSQIGLGLLIHGSAEMYGMVRTGYATFDKALAGAKSVKLDQLPSDWKIGDKIVLAGTGRSGLEDEARMILGLGGNTVTFDKPLLYNHTTPTHTKESLKLKIHMINLTRNVIITTQEEGNYRYVTDGNTPKSRGHVMFMHTNDVTLNYVGLYELGRTNKLADMVNKRYDVSDENPANHVIRPANNPIARYPCHFHRSGADGSTFGVVQGCAIDGSPGWGYVNHRGAVYIDNNVAYNVNGASFIAEIGNEIGTFRNNVTIRNIGNAEINFTAENAFGSGMRFQDNGNQKFEEHINKYGSAGDGFWFHSHTVHIKDNVASGFTGSGFVFWGQAIDGFHRDPNSNLGTARQDFVEGRGLLMQNNTAYGGAIAFSPNFLPTPIEAAKGRHRNEDFVGWGVQTGIRRKYTKALEYHNMILIGDLEEPKGDAAWNTHHNGKHQLFYKPYVEGFYQGFKNEKRPHVGGVFEGYFNNVLNIGLGIRHERDELYYFVNNTFGDLSEEALASAKIRYPSFDGVQKDYFAFPEQDNPGQALEEAPEAADGSATEGKISDYIIQLGDESYKVYLKNEQHPDTIPPIDLIENGNKTNRQRYNEGKVSSVYGRQYYKLDEAITPMLPDVHFENIVLGPNSYVYQDGENVVRDLIIERPEDFQIGLDQVSGIQLEASAIFQPILGGGQSPVLRTTEVTGYRTTPASSSSDENVATLTMNPSKTIATITPVGLGTAVIDLTTETYGQVTFEVTVVATANLPEAGDDAYDIEFNTSRKLYVLQNDTGDNETIGFEVQVVGNPSNGTSVVNSDGTITYEPVSGSSGADSFTYTITDYVGNTSLPATVTLNIIEEAPTYNVEVLEGEELRIDVSRAVSSTSGANYGTVSLEGNVLVYTQDVSSHNGSDVFTYTVNGNTGTIHITINDTYVPNNTAPVVNAGSPIEVTDEDGNGTETITLNGSISSDLEGDIVAYSWEIGGSTYSGVSPIISLAPGNYIATLTCTDDEGKSASGTTTVTIHPDAGILALKLTKADSFKTGNEPRVASNATDLDLDTYWESLARDEVSEEYQSLIVDMEGRYAIDELNFNFGTNGNFRSKNFKVYVSEDEINWTEIASYSSATRVSQFKDFSFSPAVEGRFVRFEGRDWPTNEKYRISNVTGVGTRFPNVLPVANAGSDLIVFDQDDMGVEDNLAAFSLDGSASFDTDLVDLSYVWQHTGGLSYAGVSPEITLPIGEHEFTLIVTDLDGATAQDIVNVSVVSGDKNIALYKNVSSTGTGSVEENINDGLVATTYSNTGGLPQGFSVDLEQNYDLNFAVVKWEDGAYGVDYSIQISDDGVNWNVAETITSNTSETVATSLLGKSARYVRVSVLSSAGVGGAFELKEFELYKVVTPNIAPIADAGADVIISDLDGNGLQPFLLNGYQSTDTDGSIVNYEWSYPGYAPVLGAQATMNLPIGVNIVTLTVTDNRGATATDTVEITVVDDNSNAQRIDLYDFEQSIVAPIQGFVSGGGYGDNPPITLSIESNPDSDVVNTSSKVMRCDLHGSDHLENPRTVSFLGFTIEFGQYIQPGLRYLHMKMYSTTLGDDVPSIRTTTASEVPLNATGSTYTTEGVWQDIVFDLGSTTWSVERFNLRFNLGSQEVYDAHTLYVDDIYLSNVETPFTGGGSSNMLPTALTNNYTATDTDGNGSETITLDASLSSDPDGTIFNYQWEIEGIGTYNTVSPIFSLDLPVGVCQGTLTVSDTELGENTDDFIVTIHTNPSNTLPVANAGIDQMIDSETATSVTFNGEGSYDSDGSVIGYRWEIPGVGTLNGLSVTETLPLGTTTVTLQVTDNEGGVSTDTVDVTILDSEELTENIAPVANAGGDISVGEGVSLLLDGSASYDVGGTIVSYTWDIPGSPSGVYNGVSSVVSGLTTGMYNGTLTVTDDEGATDVNSFSIEVMGTLSVEDYTIAVSQQSDVINIENLDEGTEIAVYDFMGRRIIFTKWDGNGIDVSELRQGLYILRFKVKGRVYVTEFLKQ